MYFKDYDEIIPLYPNKRNRLSLVSTSSSPIQLNRQKLEPKTIYSPTRHPHGSGSKMLADASNESKAQQDNATFRKSFFDTKQQQQTTANKHSSNGFMSSSSLNKKSSTVSYFKFFFTITNIEFNRLILSIKLESASANSCRH